AAVCWTGALREQAQTNRDSSASKAAERVIGYLANGIPVRSRDRSLRTLCVCPSTQSLKVRSDVADLRLRQTLGDGQHHHSVAARRVLVLGALVTCAACVVAELLDHVDRLLRTQGGITCSQVAPASGSVAG